MKSEIISIGTELLLGEILDSNAQYLAKELASLGIDLYYISTVGDNYERLLGVLRRAWDRSDLILTSGGLGPTRGDITRETIAGLVGEEPRVDEALKQEIEDFFKRRGMRMSLNNIRQAVVIPSSTPVRNPNGTAPGWWVEKEGRIIVSMPGPPNEMQVMWQNEVAPRLQKKTGAVILSRMLKTYGLSESYLEEKVASDKPHL